MAFFILMFVLRAHMDYLQRHIQTKENIFYEFLQHNLA